MFKILVIVVIAFVLYLFLAPEKSPVQPQTQPGTSGSESEETSPPLNTSFPSAATPSATPRRPAARPPSRPSSLENRLQSLARREGVVIKKFSQTGQEARVQIEWGGAVATLGGDFILVLMREGIIRDFDNLGQRVGNDSQGRRRYYQDILLKLK